MTLAGRNTKPKVRVRAKVRLRQEPEARRSGDRETPFVVLFPLTQRWTPWLKLAGSNDFSSFVNEALRRDIQRTQMLVLLRDLDEQFGPVSEGAKKGAKALWQVGSCSTAER
jgi:hypothetical protein